MSWQQAVRFEEQQSAKQAAISAKARGLTDRQAQRESEAQRLRDVYGDNPLRWRRSLGTETLGGGAARGAGWPG